MSFNLIDIACYMSEFIGMVLTLLSWRSLDKPLRFLGYQVILGFLMDFGWGFTTSLLHLKNMFGYNVYLFFEFYLFVYAAFFWCLNERIKKTIRIAILLMAIITIIQLIVTPNSFWNLKIVFAYVYCSVIFLYLIFEKFKSNDFKNAMSIIVWIIFIKIAYLMMQIPSLTLEGSDLSLKYSSISLLIRNVNGIANVINYAGTGICFLLIQQQKKRLNKTLSNV